MSNTPSDPSEEKSFDQAHLFRVINEVIALVPPDFANREELMREIEHFRRDLIYKAPELIPEQWERLCIILNYHLRDLSEPFPEWVQKSVKIVRGDTSICH